MVNVGRDDGIDTLTVRPVEIYSPRADDDRASLIAAVAEATEMATALPSVDFYGAGERAASRRFSPAGCCARSSRAGRPPSSMPPRITRRPPSCCVTPCWLPCRPNDRMMYWRRYSFLDTIIGKMSGAPEEASDLHRWRPAWIVYLVGSVQSHLYLAHLAPGRWR